MLPSVVTSKASLRTSIVEIARKAGVSTATVSRAFNRPELLRPETRQHVEKIALEHGFRPNLVGRSLRQGATRTLGVLLPTLNNPAFAECFDGACRDAQKLNYSIMVATTDYCTKTELESLHMLLDHQVDGLILTLGGAQESEAIKVLREEKAMPYILAYSTIQGVPSVSIDDQLAGRDLAEYVASFQHKNIAFLSGPLHTSDRAARRLLGVRQVARRLKLSRFCHYVLPSHTQCEPPLVKNWLSSNPPTAIICSNDLLALSLMSQLHAFGIRIPDDIAICGFDGIVFGAMYTPQLTTVSQPSSDIGRIACQKLLAYLKQHIPLTSTVVPHRIFPGASVGVHSPH